MLIQIASLAWPVAFVIVALVGITLGYKAFNRLAAEREREHDLARREREADLADQLAERKMADQTFDERKLAEQARLEAKAAEDNASAEVAADTIPARIDAEKQVIAARAKGRSERAYELGLSGSGDDPSVEIERIRMEGYDRYADRMIGINNTPTSYHNWVPDN